MNAAEKEARDNGEWPPLPREIENALRVFDDYAHECGAWERNDDIDGDVDENKFDHSYDALVRRANAAKVRLRRLIRKYLRADALKMADDPRPRFKVGQWVIWQQTRGGGGGSGARPNAKDGRAAKILKVGNGRAKIITQPMYQGDQGRETWVNFENLQRV